METMRWVRGTLLASAIGLLMACGGGGGSSPGGGSTTPPTTPTTPPPPPYAPVPASDADAARFLAQATFGPTTADITRLRQIGYSQWLDEQLAHSKHS